MASTVRDGVSGAEWPLAQQFWQVLQHDPAGNDVLVQHAGFGASFESACTWPQGGRYDALLGGDDQKQEDCVCLSAG